MTTFDNEYSYEQIQASCKCSPNNPTSHIFYSLINMRICNKCGRIKDRRTKHD